MEHVVWLHYLWSSFVNSDGKTSSGWARIMQVNSVSVLSYSPCGLLVFLPGSSGNSGSMCRSVRWFDDVCKAQENVDMKQTSGLFRIIVLPYEAVCLTFFNI